VTEVYNIESSPVSFKELIQEEHESEGSDDARNNTLSESLSGIFSCGPDDGGNDSTIVEPNTDVENGNMPGLEDVNSSDFRWEESDYVPFFSKLSLSLPTVPDACLVPYFANCSDSSVSASCFEEEEEQSDLVVKLVLSSKTIYRFRVRRDNYNFEELKRVAAEKWLEEGRAGEEENVNGLRLKYVDEEGDWITVVTQEEWEEAVRNFESLIKLHVC